MNRLKYSFSQIGVIPLYTGAAALVIALVWGLAIVKIADDRKFAVNSARNTLQNLAIGLKEHAQDSLNAADEALRMMKFHYETSGTENLHLVKRYFEQKAIDISSLNQVGLIDADGIYIFSSLENHNRLNLSDREHFKVHKEGYPYPLFVSKPVIGRASGKWSFQMTRRMNDKNGQFKGVAVASLNPTQFLDRFSRVQLGSDSLIGLVGLDGYARSMRVGDVIRADDNLRNLQLPPHMSEARSGYFLSDEFFDQTKRFFVFERLNDMPLFALVGISEDVAFQDFYRQKNAILMTAWLVSLLIVVLTWHKIRSIHKTEQMNAELINHKQMLQQIEDIQRTSEKKVREAESLALIGQAAIEAASPIKATMNALNASFEEFENSRNVFERLTQAYFRLHLEQINREEFLVIAKKLKPETVLDHMTNQLSTAKNDLGQLDELVSELKPG